MSLEPGTRLGPYEVLAPLGAGGMGEVYRARDTRLDRTVAVKVLPSHLSEDSRLRERFEREARAVSSLNHPHICTLHDIGREDGIDFMVLEHIQGETLAERLKKGALPIDQALRYAVEIADALDKAHRQGVVHRDLKPGNVMLTQSGAKLLDFGLAKAMASEGVTVESALPTESRSLTAEGTILGTLQYMAPEQLEGKEADARTDIFAFGALLYEMATGRRAFEGSSQASLISAIMGKEPPPISALEPMSPAALDAIVQVCLAKERDDRWQSAADIGRQLQILGRSGGTHAVASGLGRPGWRRLARPVALVLVGAAVAGSAVWLGVGTRRDPPRLTRLALSLPGPEELGSDTQTHSIAISPDGTRIAYSMQIVPNEYHWYVRRLEELEPVRLEGLSTRAESPVFSPSGEWLLFNDQSASLLQKVSVQGGPAVAVAPISSIMRGASWGEDERIVFGTLATSGLWRVSAGGSEPEEVTTPEPGANHLWPEVLPGATAVLYTIIREGQPQPDGIAVVDLTNGEQQMLIPGGTFPRYSRTGHIVYGFAGTLRAVPFDADRLEVTGSPVPLVEHVITTVTGAVDFSLALDGSLVYLAGVDGPGTRFTLTWVDRQRREETLLAEPRDYLGGSPSPDGTRAAIVIGDPATGSTDIWIYELARGTLTRLTFDRAADTVPLWSPDSTRVVFRSGRQGGGLFVKAADGTGDVERLGESPSVATALGWAPDGRLLIQERAAGGHIDVSLLSIDGATPKEVLLDSQFSEARPALAPDGRWLAYQSDESDPVQVFVRPFPNIDSGKWQVSINGGQDPKWSPDGRELYYWSGDTMMAARVEAGEPFQHSEPEAVLDWSGHRRPVSYYIGRDGRFLLPKAEVTGEPSAELILVQGWSEELKRLVPTD